ncbi:phosphoribosyltransferase [Amycolatopsis sp. TNS106]|uniref:phosphoribosyltransferase n=1 Tax=Amycolatopsis sp. TNS106 TaxID=2861750 RepID=UPI001C56EE4E|nr:phosphoribosyltransferase [Amycolatopsis sp. TNS106]QXV56512.1 phosphoribosyltransferase [Amycolatopsis sp. TNS106]
MRFQDRREAGRALAKRLRYLRGHHAIVLGLPRGGVVIAKEIADVLDAPLDILLVRKIGLPGGPELAMGALGEGGVLVTDHDVVRGWGITPADVATAADAQRAELARRTTLYRRGRPPIPVTGQTVVLADDGVATGSTASAAIRVLRARQAGKIILAVPVGPESVLDRLGRDVDQVVCLSAPHRFRSVGHSYGTFPQLEDADVLTLLDDTPNPLRRPS